jgi:hypothetical protein
MAQTAVEWLELVYHSQQGYISKKDIEEAKAMEKEQHSETFNQGVQWMQYQRDLVNGGAEYWDKKPSYFLEYYNETYKNEKDS